MAKTKISEFSSTPANNTDIDSINIAEGCAPSGINDAIRELMAQLKDFQTGAQGDSFNGPIGTSTAAAGAFTTLSATGAITSTLATGTAPLVIASTTKVANLNVDLLDGADWASPAALGSTTPAAVSATTLSASSTVTLSGGTANGVAYLNGSKVVTSGSALTFDGTGLGIGTGTIPSGRKLVIDSGNIRLSNDYQIEWGGSTVGIYGNGSTNSLSFFANTSEVGRFTSTGLGIGTSSPSFPLDISAAAPRIRQVATTGTNSVLMQLVNTGGTAYVGLDNSSGGLGGAYSLNVFHGGAYPIVFSTSGTERMRIDSSGNLGLGVTPSAWGSGYKAIQLLTSSLYGTTSRDMNLGANVYVDAVGYKYIQTSFATNYTQYQGAHAWYTAPSGTAGNAITFTQAMTLDASGRLLVGGTSNNDGAKVQATTANTDWSYSSIQTGSGTFYHHVFRVNGSAVGTITSDSSTTTYATSSDYRLKNITGPITTSGAYIDSLNPVEGTWKADGSTFVGLIAHEVQEVSRTFVATGVKDGEEMQGMDYSSAEIIANLIAEVKSLRQRLAAAGI